MSRKLTPRSSLENLKREAKRWLKAIETGDSAARARFDRVIPRGPATPSLRDVQYALAVEHGFDGWTALRDAVSRVAGATGPRHEAIQELLAGAERGDEASVRRVLDDHPDIIDARATLPGHTGERTALHFAMNSMNEQVIDLLLERGADPNIRDEGDNAFPLHFAAERGKLDVVRKLIAHGADPVGAGDVHELEVIGWAVCFAYALHIDVAEYLLAHGARHTIFSAVTMGDIDAIESIVAATPAEVNRAMDKTNHRRRPLHLAVIKRRQESLAALLEHAADTSARDAAGLTPLDQAALDGETEMARLLVERGARVELPAAIALDRRDDVERLLREDPGALGPTGRWRALILRAAERSPASVIDTLLRFGASVDAQDDAETAVDGADGYTPLHAAAFAGNADAVRVLLAHGADTRVRDTKYHSTAAGWANYAGHVAVRDMILAQSTDVFDAVLFDRADRLKSLFDAHHSLNQPLRQHLTSDPGPSSQIEGWWTPLAYAIVHDKTDAARELLRLGARTSARTSTRNDAETIRLRDFAASRGRADIVRVFDEIDAIAGADWPNEASSREMLVARFLTNACPDHHVRGGWSHASARDAAMRLLDLHPEIPRESLLTAVVCGEVELVREMIARDPELARRPAGPKGSYGVAGQRLVVDPAKPMLPLWTPLLYLCFTRLPRAATNDNAVAIATMLLDAGADPNAYFMAGDSRYSPLTGVVGEGEEGRAPHPRRNELARLLIERGADPYDVQVFYNVHFRGDVLWYLKMIYEHTIKIGRAADWQDPQWPMIDLGGYGLGARYLLDIAVIHDDAPLATWILEHGADPNAGYPMGSKMRRGTLYEEAVSHGHLAVADVLARSGARTGGRVPTNDERFVAAAERADVETMRRLIADDPSLLGSSRALLEAAARDDVAAVTALLDLGVSPNVQDEKKQRALHTAAYENALRVARLLIERGADVDAVEENYGNTPLDAAIYADHAEMIALLAERSRYVWGLTFAGAVERLREVLRDEPHRAKASYQGTTLLMYLPGDETKALAIAKLLLELGADPAPVGEEGRTAAELADARGMPAVAEVLRSAAARR
jgi:ankyrin repeat protein